MPDCCVTLFVDEQVSRANCALYVVELATIVIAAAVSLLYIDHGPQATPML